MTHKSVRFLFKLIFNLIQTKYEQIMECRTAHFDIVPFFVKQKQVFDWIWISANCFRIRCDKNVSREWIDIIDLMFPCTKLHQICATCKFLSEIKTSTALANLAECSHSLRMHTNTGCRIPIYQMRTVWQRLIRPCGILFYISDISPNLV